MLDFAKAFGPNTSWTSRPFLNEFARNEYCKFNDIAKKSIEFAIYNNGPLYIRLENEKLIHNIILKLVMNIKKI